MLSDKKARLLMALAMILFAYAVVATMLLTYRAAEFTTSVEMTHWRK